MAVVPLNIRGTQPAMGDPGPSSAPGRMVPPLAREQSRPPMLGMPEGLARQVAKSGIFEAEPAEIADYLAEEILARGHGARVALTILLNLPKTVQGQVLQDLVEQLAETSPGDLHDLKTLLVQVAQSTPHAQEAKNVVPMLRFEECRGSGYAARTRENARADATLAVAKDFMTPGERLTHKAVLAAGRLYLNVSFEDALQSRSILRVVTELNKLGKPEITLNVAGNGLYTLKPRNQAKVDQHIHALLSAVVHSPMLTVKIAMVRSGGQTGVDEAGVKAAIALGIPALVLAPKGWVFRGADGKDVADEAAFKARFHA